LEVETRVGRKLCFGTTEFKSTGGGKDKEGNGKTKEATTQDKKSVVKNRREVDERVADASKRESE